MPVTKAKTIRDANFEHCRHKAQSSGGFPYLDQLIFPRSTAGPCRIEQFHRCVHIVAKWRPKSKSKTDSKPFWQSRFSCVFSPPLWPLVAVVGPLQGGRSSCGGFGSRASRRKVRLGRPRQERKALRREMQPSPDRFFTRSASGSRVHGNFRILHSCRTETRSELHAEECFRSDQIRVLSSQSTPYRSTTNWP